MEKTFLFFMVLFVLKAMSQELSNWIRIDCGAPTTQYDKNGLTWRTDESFIKTGENKQIPSNSPTPLDQLKTLRVFTEQNKNCYILPAPTQDRYFIRAMFTYANYDGKSNPPTFDIEFDGNKWDTVETSSTYTEFSEVVYTSKGNNISVCLSRTQDEQFPFISMLELWSLPDESYDLMTKGIAWIQSYRYNYGASQAILGYPTDELNRIWIPMTPPGLTAENASFTSLDYTTEDRPPESAIIDVVEASSEFSSIFLPFQFKELDSLHQVVAYFTEIAEDANATRSFDLFVNTDFKFRIIPEYKNCTEYMMKVQAVGFLDVSLVPNPGSTLPPLISAIEIYKGIEPLVTGTSQDDLGGLAVFINSFKQLEGWSGEPCLPSDAVWQWLGCSIDIVPPRVNSLYLSGYGLSGPLPDFSQMQALERIDLSNNNLNGPIPDFLGDLPNLRLLDLRNNSFSGDIPRSISNNKKITYYLDGNPNIHNPKKKSSGLVIGLAVGLPLGLILVILLIALVYYLKRKRSKPSQEQGAEMMPQTQETASATISIDPPPPPARPPPMAAPGQNAIPTAPALDEDIREMLRLHGSSGVQRR